MQWQFSIVDVHVSQVRRAMCCDLTRYPHLVFSTVHLYSWDLAWGLDYLRYLFSSGGVCQNGV